MKDPAEVAFDIRIETIRFTRRLLRDAHGQITHPLRKEGLGIALLIVSNQLDTEQQARKQLREQLEIKPV